MAERLTNIEMRLDDLDARLDDIALAIEIVTSALPPARDGVTSGGSRGERSASVRRILQSQSQE